ncbi:MAG: polymer-forming cytoskeletal protein [Candidatus Berkelbacteria bacterium]|nr:MAG: polymer-forming cytoskeletal protein [Candidatus Berkelbacteria bacterium]QQG51998.1 MAG: polymer-forming cytoskeletal protein [Candidatus Berkelbacteria bacterium]
MLKGSNITGETDGPGTTVGVNVALSGTLRDQNDIHIFGLIDGEVISEKTVTVGKTAQVKGPVRGQIVSIAGTVRGSIDASDKLELLDTAKVFGSISTKDLVIHSGAAFVGKCTMPSEGAEEEAEEAASEEASEPEAEETEEPADVEAELTPEEE